MSGEMGLVLFAHGARDVRWAAPFHAVLARVRQRRPELAVELAFLELMQPDLASAVAHLAETGCTSVRVVPLFLGEGAHLRRDLPELVRAISERFPHLKLAVGQAAGEDAAVLDALTGYCLSEAARD